MQIDNYIKDETMLKQIRHITPLFLALLAGLNINVYAQGQDSTQTKLISWELEMFRLSTVNRGETIIGAVPEYFRRVPHYSDPTYRIDPLVDRSPFRLDTKCGFGDYLISVKAWFYSLLAIGVGPRGDLLHDDKEPARSFYYEPPHPAPVYVGYGFTLLKEEEKRVLRYLRYFIEIKTPSLLSFEYEHTKRLTIKLFGGYEPRSSTFTIRCENGWHMWSQFTPQETLTLAQVDVTSKYYYGLSFEGTDESNKKLIGYIRFFLASNDYRLNILPAGKDFGLSFKKSPFLFGGSIGVIIE